MLDSGNFVLYSKDNSTIWETFKYPTDTILGGQILSSGGQLFSSLSETNHSTGRYRLKMQYDGNLVLYPVNTADISSEAYWSSATYGFQYHLYLNYTGLLQIINSTSNDSVKILVFHHRPAITPTPFIVQLSMLMDFSGCTRMPLTSLA
jgi:hypothetical protein